MSATNAEREMELADWVLMYDEAIAASAVDDFDHVYQSMVKAAHEVRALAPAEQDAPEVGTIGNCEACRAEPGDNPCPTHAPIVREWAERPEVERDFSEEVEEIRRDFAFYTNDGSPSTRPSPSWSDVGILLAALRAAPPVSEERERVIEECARIAEGVPFGPMMFPASIVQQSVAREIRALAALRTERGSQG